MSDKSNHDAQAFSLVPGHRVLAIEGRDATRFAQAQFTTDVAGLADGHWHWSGWLTPKGRVIALFALLRFNEQRLWLVLPDASPSALAEQLQRFVFRSRLSLVPLEQWHAAGAFSVPARATGDVFAEAPDQAIELDFGTPAGARTLRLSGQAAREDAEVAERWNAFDLAHGLPRLDASQEEQWTPQQLSLQRLRAYSVKKGCYPGQEIVARTHFLGQARRGLVRLQSVASMAPGDAVTADGRDIGRVVCVAGDEALAVLPLEADAAALSIRGVPGSVLALLDGLARHDPAGPLPK